MPKIKKDKKRNNKLCFTKKILNHRLFMVRNLRNS